MTITELRANRVTTGKKVYIKTTANHRNVLIELKAAQPEIIKDSSFSGIWAKVKELRGNLLTDNDIYYLESKGINFANCKMPVLDS